MLNLNEKSKGQQIRAKKHHRGIKSMKVYINIERKLLLEYNNKSQKNN